MTLSNLRVRVVEPARECRGHSLAQNAARVKWPQPAFRSENVRFGREVAFARPQLPRAVGRDYTSHISEVLGVRDSAVAGALTSLRQAGPGRARRRRVDAPRAAPGYFRAATAAADYTVAVAAAEDLGEPAPLIAAVDLLERLDRELDLLRFEHQFAGDDVAYLVATNRPVPGL